MKRTLLVILAVMILLVSSIAFMGCKSDDDIGVNILSNPKFEELTTAGKEVGWVVSDQSSITFVHNDHDDDAYDPKLGNYYAKFNVSGGYQYAAQTVSLKENAKYLVTAHIKVTSVSTNDDIGVRIGFDTKGAAFTGFNQVKTTDDEWISIEYYFTSSEKVDAKFTVGVGSAEKTASGVAYIDNIVLARVDEIPAEYLAEHTIEVLKYSKSNTLADAGSICFVVFMALASLCIAGLVYYLIAKSLQPQGVLYDDTPKQHSDLYNKINAKIDLEKLKKALTSELAIFIYILGGALLVRFIIAVCTYGMASNIDALEELGEVGKKSGLLSYYSSVKSSTAPIGSVVTYTVLANVASWLKIKSASLGYAILVRLPQILADLVVTYMIYSFVSSHKDSKQAAIYSGFFAFIPLYFFIGSFYGATESIAIAFVIATALAILKKDYILTPALYTCALLFSNYVLVILPVILVFQVMGIIYDKESRWINVASMAICLVLFYLFGFVMSFASVKNGNMFLYFQRMYQFFKDNAYLSTDSLNLYAVFGAANNKVRSTLVEVFNWLFVAAMSAWPAYTYYKNRNRLDLILNAGVMITAYALIGAGSTITILPIGLVLLLIYIVIVPDARLFLLYSVLATLSFLNIAQLASQSGYISSVTGATYTAFLSNSAFLIIFSIIGVAALFYLIYVLVDITFFNQSNEIAPLEKDFIKQIKGIFVKKDEAKKRK